MQLVIAVNSVHNIVFDAVAHSINLVFGPTFALVVTASTVVVVTVLARSWVAAVRVLVLIAIPWAVTDLVKVIAGRARPDSSLLSYPTGVEPVTFSYPSGHTAFAAAWVLALVVVLSGWRFRGVVVAGALVVMILTGWSRVYLGAHYPTDVLASLLLAPVLTFGVAFLMARMPLFAPARDVPAVAQQPGSGR
ncbi:undecaprenyl-diphosphatase [Microbacterium pygmaeum]|uniref:Undecaprenyl-diphosphatase n=2 Tax=Microbacterium pygmaeum TaxID=370764 RepID=A0A1G8AMR3_9MICO|nr:undecaprenyl-diphosphatase [Microbacterium pygmaeum]